MVCLGNICRSPLAEGILKTKVNAEEVFVDSAGTGHWHVGNPPDPRSIAIGNKHNIDISNQISRQFKASDFDEIHQIYIMYNSNRKYVLSLDRNQSLRNKLHFILEEIFPGENVDVPDSYYGGTTGFENVFRMLDEACNQIATTL